MSTDRPHEQLHPGEKIPEEDSDESDLAKEEFFTDEEIALCDTSAETITEEKKGKPISKKVSFHVSENSEGERQVSSKNVAKTTPLSFHRIPHKSTRRSLSPVKPCPKVVSMLDTQFAKGKSVQEIHSSSALKIYALAKMHRESSSSVPLVSRPRSERRSRARHYPSQESFSAHELTNEELKRILETSEDVRRTLWTNTEQETRGKLRDKKDLVNWCINALRNKGQYPEFTHKPRLRSRRSMNLEKNEGKTEFFNEFFMNFFILMAAPIFITILMLFIFFIVIFIFTFSSLSFLSSFLSLSSSSSFSPYLCPSLSPSHNLILIFIFIFISPSLFVLPSLSLHLLHFHFSLFLTSFSSSSFLLSSLSIQVSL